MNQDSRHRGAAVGVQERILRLKCPQVDPDLLAGVFQLLKARVKKGLDIASGAAFPQPDRTSVDDVVFAYAAGKPFPAGLVAVA